MEEEGKQSNKQTWSWLVDVIQEFPKPFHIWISPEMKSNTFEQRWLNSNWNAVDIPIIFFFFLFHVKFFAATVVSDEEHARDHARLKKKKRKKKEKKREERERTRTIGSRFTLIPVFTQFFFTLPMQFLSCRPTEGLERTNQNWVQSGICLDEILKIFDQVYKLGVSEWQIRFGIERISCWSFFSI